MNFAKVSLENAKECVAHGQIVHLARQCLMKWCRLHATRARALPAPRGLPVEHRCMRTPSSAHLWGMPSACHSRAAAISFSCTPL